MRTIKLNNGSEYEINFCTAVGDVLWLRLVDPYDKTIAKTAAEFDDPNNVTVLTEDFLGNVKVYEGFTRLFKIEKSTIGTEIGLMKPD